MMENVDAFLGGLHYGYAVSTLPGGVGDDDPSMNLVLPEVEGLSIVSTQNQWIDISKGETEDTGQEETITKETITKETITEGDHKRRPTVDDTETQARGERTGEIERSAPGGYEVVQRIERNASTSSHRNRMESSGRPPGGGDQIRMVTNQVPNECVAGGTRVAAGRGLTDTCAAIFHPSQI
jgi:hypothetical protein